MAKRRKNFRRLARLIRVRGYGSEGYGFMVWTHPYHGFFWCTPVPVTTTALWWLFQSLCTAGFLNAVSYGFSTEPRFTDYFPAYPRSSVSQSNKEGTVSQIDCVIPTARREPR
jgi:hypothetical protein